MILTKKQIRELVEEGRLPDAEQCKAAELLNALTLVSSQVEDNRQNWIKGILSYEELSRFNAKNNAALMDCLEQLPETPEATSKQTLLDEVVFKRRLFLLLIAVKTIVLSYMFYLWKTGGFNDEQAMATLGSLMPAFVGYVSLMLSDFIRQSRNQLLPKRRFVSGFLANIAWWLFPIYAIAQIYIISQKVIDGNVLKMNTSLALCETMIGIYIGRMVEEFFKKEE
jgi:hypothetical protein